MIYNIFAIRDKAVEAFLVPMFFPSKGSAIRAFTDEVNRDATDNMMFKHSEDYSLWQLGVYDDSSAIFTTKPPEYVINAVEVKS